MQLPIAINLSFKSFGEDDISTREDFYFIDHNTIIFDQDIVIAASIDSFDTDFVQVIFHLTDGCTIKQKFKLLNNILIECT